MSHQSGQAFSEDVERVRKDMMADTGIQQQHGRRRTCCRTVTFPIAPLLEATASHPQHRLSKRPPVCSCSSPTLHMPTKATHRAAQCQQWEALRR